MGTGEERREGGEEVRREQEIHISQRVFQSSAASIFKLSESAYLLMVDALGEVLCALMYDTCL